MAGYERGDRLILSFHRGGRPSGRAAVVCWQAHSADPAQVVRVTRQDHDAGHAPTHYRRLAVASSRLRRPTGDELADDSLLRLWDGIERARF